MRTKTLRVNDELVDALREVGDAEHIEEAQAMRKLLRMGYEVYLAERYRTGLVSWRDVALRLNRSLSETLDTMARMGITGNTGAADTLASLRSLSIDAG